MTAADLTLDDDERLLGRREDEDSLSSSANSDLVQEDTRARDDEAASVSSASVIDAREGPLSPAVASEDDESGLVDDNERLVGRREDEDSLSSSANSDLVQEDTRTIEGLFALMRTGKIGHHNSVNNHLAGFIDTLSKVIASNRAKLNLSKAGVNVPVRNKQFVRRLPQAPPTDGR